MTSQAGAVLAPRVAVGTTRRGRSAMTYRRQAMLQLLCLLITATVLFPILWIVSLAIDPRNLARPDGLNLIPQGATLDAFAQVIRQPTQNPVSFPQLAFNSLVIAALVSSASVIIGVLAAYAFSRLQFRGREFLMIAVLAVLMLPAVTTGQLPFAIWNMKGYLDTIPRDLEEAASVDGANRFQIFLRIILPLSKPVIAVTAFFGFIAGWTEFYFSWMFLTGDPKSWTLAMTLNGMVGQYSSSTPWSQFAAYAILVALPVSIVYLYLQKYIISGLTIGGVKG